MNILSIPPKVALQFDLGDALAKLIDATFYQTAETFKQDIDQISQLRDDMIHTHEFTEESLERLYNYLHILKQLMKTFADDQISFTWCQTISMKSQSTKKESLRWEYANVLFNIAATYSLLATSLPLSYENLNTQYRYYQLSATIFKKISNEDQEIASVDSTTASSLCNLMLAQGMECFWLKAAVLQSPEKRVFKDSMITKLASQVMTYYDLAYTLAAKSELIRTDWVNFIKDKVVYFKAVTYYRMSLILQKEKKYGHMIKCLAECNILLSQCSLDTKLSFSKKVNELLKETTRDNDFIYLQVVPDDVPELSEPLNMIKLLEFNSIIEKNTEQFQDYKIFKNLLPLELINACNAYNERQDTYIKERIIDPITQLNKILDKNLSMINDLLMTKNGIKAVPAEEIENIEIMLKTMQTNHSNISCQVETIQNILDDESEIDDKLRTDHGNLNWTLKASNELNGVYISRIETIKGYLKHGHQIDNETRDIFNTIDKQLISSENQTLPENSDPEINEIINIIKNRNTFLIKVESKSMTNKILIKIIAEYRKNNENIDQRKFETIFQEHLSIFNDDLGKVQDEIVRNDKLSETLHKKIDDNNNSIQNITSSMKRLSPRDLYVEDFKYSLKLLNEVKESISAGEKFYTDLVNSTNALLKDVQKFSDERKEQKKELLSKLLK